MFLTWLAVMSFLVKALFVVFTIYVIMKCAQKIVEIMKQLGVIR